MHMKRFFVLFLAVMIGSVSAQWREVVLLEVEGDSVTAGEFATVYNKNRNIGQEIDPKTPEEYLGLYLNFKLKVLDAKHIGYDTLPSVVNEFKSYRNQLAKPYLMDKRTDEKLVYEAYERSKNDVRASHIMVSVDENASPADTLAAFRKIERIRKQLASDNSNFSELAQKHSDDEYSAQRDGDLGYFNVFDMVYPFENAAYRTNVGDASSIVRSRFGYHIVMPTDKRIARGTAEVAHIMTIANEKSTPEQRKTAKARIDEVYSKLKSGERFDDLARRYSEDKNSASKGGVLNAFGINDMVPVFEEAAFSLMRAGDVTEPIETPYGFHIIKMIERSQIKPFEEVEQEMNQKVQRDERSNLTHKNAVKKLKNEYAFKQNDNNLTRFIKQLPKTFIKGYTVPDQLRDAPLFELDGKVFGQRAFAEYLSNNFRNLQGDNIEGIGYAHFDAWVEREVMNYENSKLEDKYPEFRYLVEEYRNGILLFEMLEDKIWKPSMTDTVGLTAFFEKNRDQYMMPERAEVDVYTISTKKWAKKMEKALKKGKSTEKIEAKAAKKDALAITNSSRLVTRGENKLLDESWGETGVYRYINEDDAYVLMHVKAVNPKRRKELEESWGAASADYQTQLEHRWVKDLRETFSYTIFLDNLNEVESKILGE